MREIDGPNLQDWLLRREAEEREDEGSADNPLDRYRARGAREAFEEVIKCVDHMRGLR